MDAHETVSAWKRRLIALAETPAYVFRDTPKSLIEEHHRNLTQFAGYSTSEVDETETRLGLSFPAVFRAYLLEIAKSPGDLFRGSDLAGISDFEELRTAAIDLMKETDPALSLPKDAIVFLMHQGYTFTYILGTGGFDEPPFQWTEGDREPKQVAPSFDAMVIAELELMESVNERARASGGSYLKLNADGSSTRTFPALNSGERPLANRWWKFWR